jgi:choline dehydrogenase-like flavoprotein
LVGKYLMWDNGAFASGLFEHPLNDYKSIQVTRLVHDYYRHDPKRGFYGGGGIDARFDFYPAGFALFGMPPDAPRWGSEYKRILGEYFNRTMSLLSHTPSLPVERNTVTLDPEVKDAWGLPAIRITFDQHPDDLKNMQWMQDRQVEILEAAGARKIWRFPVEELTASRHLMGTCRMGRDPQKSVVNPFGRTYDVPNLFLVDDSNFVTSARQQPTATIQALAYRSAEHIIGLARRGELAV